jgi:hypothetical protein
MPFCASLLASGMRSLGNVFLHARTLMLWAASFPNLILFAIIRKKVDFYWADPKLR